MCWDEVFRTLYREKTEKFGWEKTQKNKTTEEIWKRLKEITKEPIIYKEKKIIKKQIKGIRTGGIGNARGRRGK